MQDSPNHRWADVATVDLTIRVSTPERSSSPRRAAREEARFVKV